MAFEKNKDIYEQYVCPHCFYTMDKCTCKVFPQCSIIWVDKGIQEHVRILNEKGYQTKHSCESHNKNGMIYISFYSNSNIEDFKLPEGFSDNGCGVEYTYPKNITNEEYAELKKRQLDILLEWCRSLPQKQKRTFR